MKLNRKDLRRLVETVINEDKVETDSEIRQQGDKSSDTQQTKNLQTGRESKFKHVKGKFSNGVVYGSREYEDSASGHRGVSLYVGKDMAKRVGVHISSKSGQKASLKFSTGGKETNAVKFLAKLVTLGVKPGDLVKVIKEISSEVDTSELEKEMNESLSRGSLYRKRYYGRY